MAGTGATLRGFEVRVLEDKQFPLDLRAWDRTRKL